MKNIEWSKLPFGYFKTNYNTRCYYRDGKWGQLEVSSSEQITMHIAATCLHYGQEAFEGVKAFRSKDNLIKVFRLSENSKRMNKSADAILMPQVPESLFREAVHKTIKLNSEFVPPYGTGASLYIRPILIGTGPQVGVKPADEYLFMVFVGPVGPYFKDGFKPVSIQIARDYDRAAPLGTGHVKVGGNYAASLRATEEAHHEGYSASLFLDAKEKKYIDECGPANFFAIKDNTYITPESHSILPSITNMSLQVLAESIGLKIEKRRIHIDELKDFEEVGACGTAADISPIKAIFDPEKQITFEYCKDGNPGPISEKLYNLLQDIQYCNIPDKYGWLETIE
ncbi:MAG: branched chain amino acid aminotransferase [Bacteroidetes bacterium GWE2_29_8]|nr:MAG: branched chain amino acid aminotransferase [Bacteroidetes bacterium GWE2_29_8]